MKRFFITALLALVSWSIASIAAAEHGSIDPFGARTIRPLEHGSLDPFRPGGK